MRSFRNLWVYLLFLTISGCAAGPDAGSVPAGSVTSGTWVLESLGGNPVAGLAEHLPTLRFGADGEVSGADGCNRIHGRYATDGPALSFSALASTRMGCTQGEALAQAFAAALSITLSYELDSGVLSLFDSHSTEIMRFAQQGD
jgi:heat shock protein HslJ